jgi:carbon-monoxide dehydrogenase medium subunit
MYVPDFDYYSPSTLEEACGVLAGLGEGARVLAGGTDLLPKMKNELLAPKALVSLKKIRSLGEITYDPEKGIVIGARATHNDLVNSLLLQQGSRYL